MIGVEFSNFSHLAHSVSLLKGGWEHMLLHLCVMVWVEYIKASDKARHVSPPSHISHSLSSTKSNGIFSCDENPGVSPTTPLKGNRTRVR